MELEETSEEEGDPFDDLAERLDEREEDAWEDFAERAVEDGHFFRGGSAGERPDGDGDLEEAPVTEATPAVAVESPAPEAAGPSAVEILEQQAASSGGVPDDDGVASEGLESAIESETVPPEADETLEELIDEEDERLDPDDVRRVGDDEAEYVVPKDGYCEGCEHFSEPPDVGCAHRGTEIVEFEDLEHVRVRHCPVVEDRRQFEDLG